MTSLKLFDPRDRLWAYVRAAKEKMAAEGRVSDNNDRRAHEAEAARHARGAELAMQDKIRALAIRFLPFGNYEDDGFLADHAKTHAADLLGRRDEILAAYQELHSDPLFLARLQAQDPHTYARATFEARALAQAERVTAQPSPAPPPRRRPTVDEVRARLVAKVETKADDKIARTKKKVEKIFQARHMLDDYPDLAPDEREQLENELTESILTEEEETNGTTRKEII